MTGLPKAGVGGGALGAGLEPKLDLKYIFLSILVFETIIYPIHELSSNLTSPVTPQQSQQSYQQQQNMNKF